jgi:SAM-dependent methyltransferase
VKNYALDNSWQHADHRLELLENQLDSSTMQRITNLGVGSGMRCLEIGAGRGSIVKWLSTQVGKSGTVTALDINTDLISKLTLENVEIRIQDLRTEELPCEAFDFVHARWILWHLPNADDVIRQMVRSLRPGGWLLVEEADYFSLDSAPASPYRSFMESLVGTLASESGGNAYWARTLLEKISVSGLVDTGVECGTQVVQGGTPLAELYALTGLQIRDKMIESGMIDLEQFNEAIASLEKRDFFGFGGVEIAMWGQKKI